MYTQNLGSRSSSMPGTPTGYTNQQDSLRQPSDTQMSLSAHKRSLEQLLSDVKQRINLNQSMLESQSSQRRSSVQQSYQVRENGPKLRQYSSGSGSQLYIDQIQQVAQISAMGSSFQTQRSQKPHSLQKFFCNMQRSKSLFYQPDALEEQQKQSDMNSSVRSVGSLREDDNSNLQFRQRGSANSLAPPQTMLHRTGQQMFHHDQHAQLPRLTPLRELLYQPGPDQQSASLAQHQNYQRSNISQQSHIATAQLDGLLFDARRQSSSQLANNQSCKEQQFGEQKQSVVSQSHEVYQRGQKPAQLANPFLKSLEIVLSHAQQPSHKQLNQAWSVTNQCVNNALQNFADEVIASMRTLSFLVKFKNASNVHCQWIDGSKLVLELEQDSILELGHYIEQNVVQQQIIRFSKTPIMRLFARSSGKKVDCKAHEDLLKRQKIVRENIVNLKLPCVERILGTTSMYPLIHKDCLQRLDCDWQDECLRIMEVLINVRKDFICFGLKFTNFDPMFSSEIIAEKRKDIELNLQGPLIVTDLTQLQNILYNRALKGPQQFWQSLGDVFKICITLEPDEHSKNRQLCSIMRFLALQLFKKWKSECPASYDLFIKEQIELSNTKKEALEFRLDRCAQLNPGSMIPSRLTHQTIQFEQQTNSQNDSNQLHQTMNPSVAQDLSILKGILHQNQSILEIQMQMGREDSLSAQSSSTQTLNLFLNNQSLFEQLMNKVNKKNIKSQDLSVIKTQHFATQKEQLVLLRNNLLGQRDKQLKQMSEQNPLSRRGSVTSNQMQCQSLNSEREMLHTSKSFLFEEQANKNSTGNYESVAQSQHDKRVEDAANVVHESPILNNNLTFYDGQHGKKSDGQQSQHEMNQDMLSEQPNDFTIYSDRERNAFTSMQKVFNGSITHLFQALKNDKKLLSEVIDTQCKNLSHELSWLLLLAENEFEVATNPHMSKDEAMSLSDSLFEKPVLGVKDAISASYKSSILAEADRDKSNKSSGRAYSSEPLFLVKWQSSMNTQPTWEPISVMNQPQDLRKVDQFLDMNHKPSMSQRELTKKLNIVLKQQQKLQEDYNTNTFVAGQANLFNAQKEILDSTIQQLMAQQEQSKFNNLNSSDSENSHASHKISQLQNKNVAHLIAAFYNNNNMIICDQKGLGNRITLTYFLRTLCQRSILYGPVLIIAQKSKLQKWQCLLDLLTKFQTLIYHKNGACEADMESLRQWSLFYLDVTAKGKITTRNRQPKFNVLLTTPERISDQNDPLIRQIIFTQVIVDDAHIKANREATQQVLCKRIICSTSNPMPNGLADLIELVATVNPDTVQRQCLPPLSQQVTSLSGIEAIWRVVNPVVRKNFHSDVEKLFGPMTQIELEVPMTTAQIVLYKEIYRRYQQTLTELEKLEYLGLNHQTELYELSDLLLRTCNSAFLVDSNEALMDNYKVQGNGKKELSPVQKQGLVSGKIQILLQLITHLINGSKKVIICTHYDHLLVLLKKVFKETGIGCFQYQESMKIDSVQCFNVYNRPAVFLLQIGQTWPQEDCSFFNLDLIQNMIIFDQKGELKNDLIQVFQVCQLPFTVNVNVYRLISKNSFEQRLYQRKKSMHSLQMILFDSPDNPWANFDQNLDNYKFKHPIEISTLEETGSQESIALIPLKELDLLMRVSAEPISASPPSQVLINGSWLLCLRQIFVNSLNVDDQFGPQEFGTLLKHAKIYGSTSNRNLVNDFYSMVTALQASPTISTIHYSSKDYYALILGVREESSSLELCCHSLCNEILFPAIMSMRHSSEKKDNKIVDSSHKRQKMNGEMHFRDQINRNNESVRSHLNDRQQMEINEGGNQKHLSDQLHSRSEIMTAQKHVKQKEGRKFQSEIKYQAADNLVYDMIEVSQDASANVNADEVIPYIMPKAVEEIKQSLPIENNIEKLPPHETEKRGISDTVSSQFWQLVPKLNQPDKLLQNGKICSACFLFVENDLTREAISSSKRKIYICQGQCKRIFHEKCILNRGLIKEGSIEQVPQNDGDQSSQIYNFMCKTCHEDQAQCFICQSYGPIVEDDGEIDGIQKTKKQKGQEECNDLNNGVVKSVKQCVIGPCSKFYHKSCLKAKYNVEFYTNSHNKQRFRCPRHYCVGCSISGNSVQILQCVACPTSYHMKCFRGDKQAIKLTKKFIVCGKHTDIISRIQQLNRKVHTKRLANRVPISCMNQQKDYVQRQNEAENFKNTRTIISLSPAKPDHPHGDGPIESSKMLEGQGLVQHKLNDNGEDGGDRVTFRARDTKKTLKTEQKITDALNKYKPACEDSKDKD